MPRSRRRRSRSLGGFVAGVIGLCVLTGVYGAISKSTTPTISTPVAVANLPPTLAPVGTRYVAPTATHTTVPTPIPTATVIGAPTAPPIASGGLGLSQEAWEALHGPPSQSRSAYDYENKTYRLYYWSPTIIDLGVPQPVQSIRQSVNKLSLAAAQTAAHKLIPSDARLLHTLHFPDKGLTGMVVEIYHSAGLIPLYFPKDYHTSQFEPTSTVGPNSYPWGGSASGTFTVVYDAQPVEAIWIETGTDISYLNIQLTPVP